MDVAVVRPGARGQGGAGWVGGLNDVVEAGWVGGWLKREGEGWGEGHWLDQTLVSGRR